VMSNEKKLNPSLGVIRLDYDYPAAPGDIDCPESFAYDVYYKVVPGFTFEMAQAGPRELTDAVKQRFIESIKWLVEEKKVSAITGDCGFMVQFQGLAREVTDVPVFMSSLCLLPSVTCGFSPKQEIIIFTANEKSLEPLREIIREKCAVDTLDKRYNIIGCEDVDGFEAVALGEKVDTKKVEPGIVQKALDSLKLYPNSKAFLLECTEMPPYADAIRCATGLPVFDAITACNFFMEAFQDNVRFGKQGWQDEWDGEQEKYKYGDHLGDAEKQELVNKVN